MSAPIYDQHAEFYDQFITRSLAAEFSHFNLANSSMLDALGDLGVRELVAR